MTEGCYSLLFLLYCFRCLLKRASPFPFNSKAVERLNIKSRNFRDLLNDEVFKRSDIITLQDPRNLEKFDVSQFYHIKQSLTVDKEGGLYLRSTLLFMSCWPVLCRGGARSPRADLLPAPAQPRDPGHPGRAGSGDCRAGGWELHGSGSYDLLWGGMYSVA